MDYEVLIVGGGIVGSLLACLLGQTGRRVALIETQRPTALAPPPAFELRVSALNRASQQALQQVGAWPEMMAQRLAPYASMVVWDATGRGEIRFDAADLGETELGHIVENKVIQHALLALIERAANIDLLCPAQLATYDVSAQGVQLSLRDGRTLRAQLLVGADGAHSSVRAQANIAWRREDYGQKGLVCVAKTSSAHQATAWQRFMPTGPLAFLPLADPNYCSIVWSLPADRADVLLQQQAAAFHQSLSEALDYRLGEVLESGPRAAFILQGARAEHYAQEQVVLVGDAAHTIHPLAGQGVNLGIRDVLELSTQLADLPATELGNLATLRRYERARKGDNMLTLKAMEGLAFLFGNRQPVLKFARNEGLALLNHLPLLKQALARQAMGV